MNTTKKNYAEDANYMTKQIRATLLDAANVVERLNEVTRACGYIATALAADCVIAQLRNASSNLWQTLLDEARAKDALKEFEGQHIEATYEAQITAQRARQRQ